MSFQAYIDNVETKTGKGPETLKALAVEKGLIVGDALAPGVTATQITDWLKSDFDLGHGHAMAIYAWFKGKRA